MQSTCSPPGTHLRTLAYVDVQCQSNGIVSSIKEALFVRRGNCDPVNVIDLPAVDNIADPFALCGVYGAARIGAGSVTVGRFQRLAVLPDGSGVVVELTNDHSLYLPATPDPPQEGIFFVRSDGTGLRRLGPQSELPLLTAMADPASPARLSFSLDDSVVFSPSPDGRRIAFADIGRGPDGEDAPQIFILDIRSGRRTQVTHLPPTPPGTHRVTNPFFATDGRTLLFYRGTTLYRVGIDRSEPHPAVDAVPGGIVVPRYGVTGAGTNVLPAFLDGTPRKTYVPGDRILELFFLFGRQAIQLTNFGYPDTGFVSTASATRVFFATSADPVGDNPLGMCQLFSITHIGTHTRQLTHFPDDGGARLGCLAFGAGVSCTVEGVSQDPRGRLVTFLGQCDPVGRNPNGQQFFAMRPDGTGLRQLSSFRGTEHLADGSVRAELGGPVAFAGLR
jgi:WD40-like Beta Propeller Repeat